jgi:hypothetical protein
MVTLGTGVMDVVTRGTGVMGAVTGVMAGTAVMAGTGVTGVVGTAVMAVVIMEVTIHMVGILTDMEGDGEVPAG